MAAWFNTFDDQFWIMLCGMVLAFMGIIAKSKCSRVTCCGIEIERDVRAELAAERQAAMMSGPRTHFAPTPGSAFSSYPGSALRSRQTSIGEDLSMKDSYSTKIPVSLSTSEAPLETNVRNSLSATGIEVMNV